MAHNTCTAFRRFSHTVEFVAYRFGRIIILGPHLLLSARTAMWSMPVVLTEMENENDSPNQNDVAKMTLQKMMSQCHMETAVVLCTNPLICKDFLYIDKITVHQEYHHAPCHVYIETSIFSHFHFYSQTTCTVQHWPVF